MNYKRMFTFMTYEGKVVEGTVELNLDSLFDEDNKEICHIKLNKQMNEAFQCIKEDYIERMKKHINEVSK